MAVKSAGIVVYKRLGKELQVLLVHPGGPFWAKKDAGAWSIPKGEVVDGETAEVAARREFMEELGLPVPDGQLLPLGSAKITSAKILEAWAVEGQLDADQISSQTFEMVWPPKSGLTQSFPEVDRAGWFGMDQAAVKLHPGQTVFLTRLAELLDAVMPEKPSGGQAQAGGTSPKPQQTSLF